MMSNIDPQDREKTHMMSNRDPREKTHYDYGDPWNGFSLCSRISLIRSPRDLRFYFKVSIFKLSGCRHK